MRSPSAWLAASSCLLVVAGCGSSSPRSRPAPKIPPAVAARLSADADAVAGSPGCAAHDAAARLQADAIASISRVPSRYREPIMSAANEIAGRASFRRVAYPVERTQEEIRERGLPDSLAERLARGI